MNKLACEILSSGFMEDANGAKIRLHSNTSIEQAEFLMDQVRKINATTTLEVGLAYGISALCIADAIKDMPNARHHVIDPFQNTESWNGIGLKNLERAGLMPIIDFRDMLAQDALPQLIRENVKIDFAYIDAGKRMDDILIFTHYIERLLRIGGLIAYDDLAFPGIRKALRYILQQDHFVLKESFDIKPQTLSRRLVSTFARWFPGGERIFAPELLLSDTALGISAGCVVVEKVSEPIDDWKWHPFF